MQRGTITRINQLLTFANILIASYLIVFPFIPQIDYLISQATDRTQGYVFNSALAQHNLDPTTFGTIADMLQPIPQENTLVIPQIGVNGLIYSGNSSNYLLQGIWHRPNTSTPDQGGNTVLVAHRFQYTTGPNTFYHLDKLKVGDQFAVFWEGKEYDYQVYATSIVSPMAHHIEADTDESILTMYTCTPLWTAQNRLVVRSKLLAEEPLK